LLRSLTLCQHSRGACINHIPKRAHCVTCSMLKLRHGIDQTRLFGAQTARKSAGLLEAPPERLEKRSVNGKTIDEGACPVLTREAGWPETFLRVTDKTGPSTERKFYGSPIQSTTIGERPCLVSSEHLGFCTTIYPARSHMRLESKMTKARKSTDLSEEHRGRGFEKYKTFS
jgi:hypothetical protein